MLWEDQFPFQQKVASNSNGEMISWDLQWITQWTLLVINSKVMGLQTLKHLKLMIICHFSDLTCMIAKALPQSDTVLQTLFVVIQSFLTKAQIDRTVKDTKNSVS